MKKIILHSDLNNFFASAALTKNPTLKNMPVAVCGDSEKRHGIVLAKNNIAKTFGVKTAEPIWEAKQKCPNLVTIAPDYKLYESLSKKVQKIYYDYSDKIEPFGIDECWIDISNPDINITKAEEIAYTIKERVKRELGLTLSIGISFTKAFAKLGSDMKKPDAITVISKENFKNKVWPLKCNELLMVGKATYNTLNSMGIFSIGDLALADTNALKTRLGKNGIYLKNMALGIEKERIMPFTNSQKPKSISNSATAERDLTNNNEVFSSLLYFSEMVAEKLKSEELYAKTIVVSLKTYDFKTKEIRAPLIQPTNTSFVLARAAMDLFLKSYSFEKPLRAVGIRATNLISQNRQSSQLTIFENNTGSVQEIIDENMLEIRNKYGKESIKRASCMTPLAKPSSPGFYKK